MRGTRRFSEIAGYNKQIIKMLGTAEFALPDNVTNEENVAGMIILKVQIPSRNTCTNVCLHL